MTTRLKIMKIDLLTFLTIIFCILHTSELYGTKLTNLLTSTLKNIKVIHIKKRLLKEADKTLCNGYSLDEKIKQFKHPLPFNSAKDAKKAYLKLWQDELNLKDKKLWIKAISLDNSIDPSYLQEEIVRHQSNILFYCQRLFRYIVKNDIENKSAYTTDLGMTIDHTGDLKMALRPLDANEQFQQNIILLLLCTSKNSDVLQNAQQQLRDLNKKRCNLSQCADSFFPDIVLSSDDHYKTSTVGYYNSKKNTIKIPQKYLKIKYLLTILHEFCHRKQSALSDARCGFGYSTFTDRWAQFPHTIRIETDAEQQSVMYHPYPEHLLVLLENQIDKEFNKKIDRKNDKKSFPYFSPLNLYGTVLTLRKLKENTRLARNALRSYHELEGIGQKVVKHCSETIKGKIKKSSKYRNSCALIQENNNNIIEFSKSIKEKTILLKLITQNDVIRGYTRMNGCKEYYDKKCELLGIKSEDKQKITEA